MVNSSSRHAQKRGAHAAPGSSWKRTTAVTVATVVTASLACAGVAGFAPAFAAIATSPYDLGGAASYAVLAAAAVTAPGATITGDVAAGAALTTPGTKITASANQAPLTGALADATTAYGTLKGLKPTTELTGDLGGMSLAAGVYHSAAALAMTTTLTLNGSATDVYVFQSDAAMNTTAGVKMDLGNVKASNVYFVPTGAATLGASSSLGGTIISGAAVTIGASATLTGRAISTTAAVTLGASDTVFNDFVAVPVAGAGGGSPVASPVAQSTTVKMGAEANYGVLAAAAVTAPGSTIVGNVGAGAALTAPAATMGTVTNATDTQAALKSLNVTYGALKALTPTSTLKGDDLGGQTILPGVYHNVAALAATGVVTFDGGGQTNPIFVIQSDAALNTTAGFTMVLKNGASAANIYWVTTGAATLGASSGFVGNILANAAVTVGASTTVTGRALSVTAAVTLGASVTINGPTVTIPVVVVTPTAPTFNNDSALASTLNATQITSSGYSILAGAAVTAPGSTVAGSVAATAALTAPGMVITNANPNPNPNQTQAFTDLNLLQATLNGLKSTELTSADLGGQVLTGGVYHSAAALAMTSTLTLNGDGNSVFVFQSDAAMNTTAGVNMVLHGVNPANVYFVTVGAVTLGASSHLYGTIVANAAVTVGASSTVTGHAYSVTAAVTLGATVSILAPANR